MQNDDLKKNMLEKYLLVEGDYVVFTPTALIKHYAESDNDYLAAVKELIEILVSQGKNIVLMPHVFNTEKRDERWVIGELEKMLSDTSGVTYIKDMLLPSECRAIVSGCNFSIACRMHAAVSTLQTGKPTIALSYSIKYAGVIGGDMKLPELVIESRNSELWKSGIVNQIIDKVNFVENNYDQLCAKIEERVKYIKHDQNRIMSTIYEQIELNKGAPFDK
jgi:colanic acid/amylovoran biosynthesis protein